MGTREEMAFYQQAAGIPTLKYVLKYAHTGYVVRVTKQPWKHYYFAICTAIVLNKVQFASWGAFGNAWRHFWLS